MTRDAAEAFEDLIRRYPNGLYTQETASSKLDLTQTHLAGKEMSVGRFYLEAGHYGAAITFHRCCP